MAYVDYVTAKPDPTTDNGVQAFDYTRENLLAMRDAFAAGAGWFPGWNVELQNSNGSPASDPTKPYQIVLSKGSERLKAVYTYSGALVSTIKVYYSGNAGSSYDIIKGGSSTGTYTLNYSGNYFISGVWS